MRHICYNWMPLAADHCLDYSEKEYEPTGVKRLHSKTLVPENVKDGDVVFVKTDFIEREIFQREYLPKIRARFILVTGVSDIAVTDKEKFVSILKDERVIKWYAANNLMGERIESIPIGFSENEYDGGNGSTLSRMGRNAIDFEMKSDFILLPVHTDTNSNRAKLYNALKELPFVYCQKEALPFSEYMGLVNAFKYVFCFEGNGVDTHRYYEALLVNSVPIITAGSISKMLSNAHVPNIHINQGEDIDGDWFFELDKGLDFSHVDSFLDVETHIAKMRDTVR